MGNFSDFTGGRFEHRFALNVHMEDISNTKSVYVVSPCKAKVKKIYSVIAGAVTSDAVITPSIGGTNIKSGAITITGTGSAAGTIDSCTPTEKAVVNEGAAIKLTSNGGSTNDVDAHFTLIMEQLPS